MWRTLLSRCIYTSPSGYKVHQNYFYRWLTMNSSALQTVINRKKPHNPVLHYLPALTHMARQLPGSVCLLGLGGAGIPLMLANHPMDVVDNSEEVIYIAQHYFLPKTAKHINIIHENAADYLRYCTKQYGHLIVDLYGPNFFPPECAKEGFFHMCASVLAPDGFISINLANLKEQWPLYTLIKKHFKNTLVLPIKKSANMVIIASNHLSAPLFLEAINVQRVVWMDSWGYVGEYRTH